MQANPTGGRCLLCVRWDLPICDQHHPHLLRISGELTEHMADFWLGSGAPTKWNQPTHTTS